MTCKQCDGLANWKDTYAFLHEFNHHRSQHEQLKKQIVALESENQKLKESVVDWKNAWFKLRDIIGNLWWHHPQLTKKKAAYKHEPSATSYDNDGNIRKLGVVCGRWKP
jgi:hypothetical protein